LKISIYTRQFENNIKWFQAGGFAIQDLPLAKKAKITFAAHIWNQPENLGFNDLTGKMGGAIELIGKYFFNLNQKTRLHKISIDFGMIYKTKGFLPEEIYLRKHFGFRLGTSIGLDKIL
jgi:hypothetical protein